MKRVLTCIVCPVGCEITVETDGGKVVSVSGNSCPRGAKYAESECTNPVRTLTTTILGENGIPVPVKSDKPVPKDKIFECMKIINSHKIKLPVSAGDIVISDIAGCGSNIVASADAEGI